MLTIKIGEKEYDLEFTFAAADEKNLIQSMFKIVSGAYFFNHGKEETMAAAMMNGTAEMVADLPIICKQAFYAGLKEHHEGITYEEAIEFMKAYMKENKLSFNALFQLLKTQMEEDGFFKLTGIVEMMEQMSREEEEEENEENLEQTKKLPKTPQDHLKKSIGTK